MSDDFNLDTLELTALVGSRICHDLISPIGAIGNGVELMGMSGDPASPELVLISDAVRNANARIRFFRVAFGAAARDQVMARSEVVAILNDMSQAARTTLRWEPLDDAPRPHVRMSFLAIQALENALPRGGQITVHNEGPNWSVTGSGDDLRTDGPLWDSLRSGELPEGINASQVHFALIPKALAAMERSLSFERTADTATIRF